MRLHKPIGILLLLWPTMWGVIIASHGHPPLKILFIFIAGVIVMRSAGCVINDLADRQFDGHVERTRQRPLVTGIVTPKEALVLFLLLCVIAVGLVSTLSPLTILLAIPALLWAASYPYMKRITNMPQVMLGVAFSWGIPMAFAAISNNIPSTAWLLMLANILWVIAYDTEYAMVDREDDLRIGIKSTAILFGKYDRLSIGILQTCTIAILAYIGGHLPSYTLYYVCLAFAAVILGYQQYLIRAREPAACFKAFLNNNWFGLVILAGIVVSFKL